jgi:hypothetical protein
MLDQTSGAAGLQTGGTDTDLALLALRYAAGVLPPAEVESFESRLGTDQAARDALAEAVRLSAAASGMPAPAPDPLVRVAATERLRPTWLTRLFPRRPYRGHPLAWAGIGGTVAASVVVLGAVYWNAEPEYVSVPRLTTRGVMGPIMDDDVTASGATGVVGKESPDPKWVAGDPLTNPKLNPMGLEDRSPVVGSRIPTLAGRTDEPAQTVVPKPMPTTPRAERPIEPDPAEPTVAPPDPKKG